MTALRYMVLLFAGLSYLPALTLGPIAEHVLRFSLPAPR